MKWFKRKKPNRKVTPDVKPSLHWRKPMLFATAAFAAVAAGIGVFTWLDNVDWERFRTLQVTGELDRVNAAQVHAVLEPHIERGFARIDMGAARQALEALPWIAEAAVRREWPATLVVAITEERPVATWFGTALMNASGEVFVDGATGFSGVLPDVGGPSGTQRDMIERLHEIGQATQASGVELRRLLRTERRAERFWLENGVEVRLGRRDAGARLQRFLDVAWPELKRRADRIAYVDMRYTNGFSVGWKSAGATGTRRERG